MGTVETASTGFSKRPSSCQPGTLRLLNYEIKTFHAGNDGCWNPNSVLQPSGRPSWHVYGKACDAACNLRTAAGQAIGNAVWDFVMSQREALNLQQMIAGHRIWDIEYGERVYHHDDHMDHVHQAIGYQASQLWFPPGAPPPKPPTPVEIDTMSEFFYTHPAPPHQRFHVASPFRTEISKVQENLLVLGALPGKIADVGTVTTEQLTACERFKLVSAKAPL